MDKTANSKSTTDRRGTQTILMATAVAAVAVLAFQAIASRSLGPDEFAPVALLWTLMFILHTVLLLPAEQHLTRALVVTRGEAQIKKVRREMILAFGVAVAVGVLFTIFTLDRFFGGGYEYVALIVLVVAARSLMAAGRGNLAGKRRFRAYGASIAIEALTLLVGAVVVAALDGAAVAYGAIIAIAPLATLLVRPFGTVDLHGEPGSIDAQGGSFLAWLVFATGASQLIIAGGPIAVSFVGGDEVAVSIFFTSFALMRGPLTSAYNLAARVLPDFTALAHSDRPEELWKWSSRIALGGGLLAVISAAGAGLLLRPIVEAVYGTAYSPPLAMAVLGGAGVGLGLGALFATQIYSAADSGKLLAVGWIVALLCAVGVLVWGSAEPVQRVALAFAAGDGAGLLMLGVVLPRWASQTRSGSDPASNMPS